MPWYSFTVLASTGAPEDVGSTNLSDDDAAPHYGRLIIRELKQREGDYDPKLKLVIRNRAGTVSRSLGQECNPLPWSRPASGFPVVPLWSGLCSRLLILLM